MKNKITLLLITLAGTLCGCTIAPDRIALPVDTHLVELGVGVQPVPLSEGWTCVRITPFWWDDDRILAANLGLVTVSRANTGVAVGGLVWADSGVGVSVGLVDINKDHWGVRVGGINCGGKQIGAQIGLFNYCSEDSHALQIGLLNWNSEHWWPMPFVNFANGKKDEAETRTTN